MIRLPRWIRDMSIRFKIVFVVLLVSTLTSAISALISYAAMVRKHADSLLGITVANTRLVAQYCVMPLEFADAAKAEDVLGKLRALSYIQDGLVLGPDGRVFASFHRADGGPQRPPPGMPVDGYLAEADFLHVQTPVAYRGRVYGSVYLRVSTDSRAIARKTLFTWMAILASMSVLAVLLALRLQRIVSVPILRLTRFTHDLVEQRGTGARIEKSAADETGRLYDAFNHMIGVIQSREADLRSTTEELNRFFDISLDLLCIADTGGRFLRLNKAWERILGFRVDELLAKPFLEFVHPGDLAATQAAMAALSEGREVVDFINRFRCQDGAYRWIEWRSVPVGHLIYAAARDVSERMQADEAIRRSEEFLRQVIENASGVPFQLAFGEDLGAGHYTQVGAGIERLFGIKPDGFTESFFVSIVRETVLRVPGVPADPVECRRRMRAGEISRYRADIRVQLPDGTVKWVNDSSLPVRDQETGRVVGAMGILLDITEQVIREEEVRRLNVELEQRVSERTAQFVDANERLQREIAGHMQAEERLRIFQQFVEASGQGLGMATPDTRIIYMNSTLCRWLGETPGEPASWKTFLHYYPPEMRERLQHEVIPEVLRAGQWAGELALLDPQGSRIPTIESFFVIRNAEGQVAYLADVITDISERKRSEEQLKRNRDQLASANKELESFAYSVSHDLRAPLRGIDGWSQALIEDYAGSLDATARGYLETVRGETKRMAQLIDALLQLSRVARSEMKRVPVDLSALAGEVDGELRLSQPERDVEFRLTPGLDTVGDRTLLLVLMRNLLGNAWKFSAGRRGAIVEFGRRAGPEAAFFVRDNGAGFDMAFSGKLFTPFQRLHGQEEFPGTGIGLATVQRIVHRHGGRIWAEGEPGIGATFFFTL